ncbi:MAG: DEAD/DEAH box helicase family protein [Cyanobium sp. MAG06]|nr:DEAD/DEAH box helicase family protein [Cyanobium sp. MAG06]
MTNNTLYNIYDSFSSRGFLDTDDFNRSFIKIKNNLNNRFVLRDYQVDAFKRFLYYIEKDNQINRDNNGISINTHLAFQMATGSGKTIIMAGFILYLYEKGYRNFLFFVNSNNIINKTKDNFLNKSSNKYLFNENISINNKIISIKEVNNFEGVNNEDINICFTTTHQLHTDLNNEKENSITIKDFEKYKIILLSDEAHHSQSTTKSKSKNKDEKQSTFGEKFESES